MWCFLVVQLFIISLVSICYAVAQVWIRQTLSLFTYSWQHSNHGSRWPFQGATLKLRPGKWGRWNYVVKSFHAVGKAPQRPFPLSAEKRATCATEGEPWGRETLVKLERSHGQDLRGWALQPAPDSASPTGLQLGKADCQTEVGQTLHKLVVVGGGFSP